MLAPLHRTPSLRIVFMIAAVLLSALVVAPTAYATSLAGINLVLMYESPSTDTPLLGVTARLPDDAQLPTEIVLPVPSEANVMWSGEFFVEATERNILVEAQQEIRNGVPTVVFPLSQSRIGHAEVTYPDSIGPVNSSTGAREVGFDVTLPFDTGPIYAAIALPANTRMIEGSDLVEMSRGDDGFTYYSFERASGKAGEQVALSLTVVPTETPQMHNEPVPWITALVVAAIIGAVLLIVARRGRTSEGSS